MEIEIIHVEAQIRLFKLESLTVVRESKLSYTSEQYSCKWDQFEKRH